MGLFDKKKDPVKEIQKLEELDRKKNGDSSLGFNRRKPMYDSAKRTFEEYLKWKKSQNSPFKKMISWDQFNHNLENNVRKIFSQQEKAQNTVADVQQGIKEIRESGGEGVRLGLFKKRLRKTAVDKAQENA